jgi:serine/threonine protein kinase
MSDEPSTPLDEQLLPWLVACDKALAASSVHEVPHDTDPPSELRQRLEGDLACIQLLRQVLPRRAPSERVVAPSGLPLRRLGRFQIHRELGHGAFGMVFLATDPHLGREVALKVPRPEALLTAELRERFVREARAAAGLDHPNVVPVYEAGAEGPLCYIASAYCPGVTLTEWLAKRADAVPLRQAATLVATLAEAVQHAHERGVIHRDLKPSNVLLQGKPRDPTDANSTVNEPSGGHDSAEPEPDFLPRITDFGLAKLTTESPGQPGEGDGVRTQSGALLGTPNYMAPEQASGKNKEIGPAADVYALGVILYELLTGRTPFLGETVLDTLEQVRSREPLPPHRLRPKLSRDLETICLKCLAKEPRKRYESAAALADDLHRYLAGAPIQARPVSTLERGIKWARRKPAQATLLAGALVFISVVLGSSVILWQTNEDLKKAVIAKEEKRLESNDSFRLARMAVDDFATKVSKDKRLRAHDFEGLRKEFLQSASNYYQQYVKKRADDPDVQEERAWAFYRLALLTREMGGQQEAIESLQEAAGIFTKLAQEHPGDARYRFQLSKALNNLGAIHTDLRREDLAKDAFEKTCDNLRQLVADHPTVPEYQEKLAGCIGNLGVSYEHLGQSNLAEAAYRESRDLWAKLTQAYPSVEEYRSGLAKSHFDLGMIYLLKGPLSLAGDSFVVALDLRRKLAQDNLDNPDFQDDLADSLIHVGIVHEQTRHAKQAVTLYLEAGTIYQKLADDHPKLPNYRDSLARVHHNLGVAYERLGEPKLAEAAYDKSCEVREQLARDYPKIPDYSFSLSMTQYNLAFLFRVDGRLKQASAVLGKAHEIQNKLVEDYPAVIRYSVHLGKTCRGLGLLDLLQGKYQPALGWFDKSVQMLEAVLKQEPRQREARPSLNEAYKLRVETLTRLERYADALADLDRLLELAGGEKSDSLRLLRAVILARMGQHGSAMTEADKLFGEASMSPNMLYDLACLCSLCSAAIRRHTGISKAQQDSQAEQYAVRAVELLKKARAAGFFTPAAIEEMRKDKDLDVLRQRPDFQELLLKLQTNGQPEEAVQDRRVK